MKLSSVIAIGLLALVGSAAEAATVAGKVCKVTYVPGFPNGSGINYVQAFVSSSGNCATMTGAATFYGEGSNFTGAYPSLLFPAARLHAILDMLERTRIAGGNCALTSTDGTTVQGHYISCPY